MGYQDFKDLNKIPAADKVLRDKAFILLKIQNMMDINVDLLQWSIDLLIKKLQVKLFKIKTFLIKS